MAERGFRRRKNPDEDEGEKERMLDTENSNNDDDRENRNDDDNEARPKRGFRRNKSRNLDAEEETDEGVSSSGGGGRLSSADPDAAADAKGDQPSGENDNENEGASPDGEIQAESKKSKKWSFGRGKKDKDGEKKGNKSYFGRGKKDKNDDKNNSKDNDDEEDDIEKGNKGNVDKDLYLGPLRVLEPMRTDVVKAKEIRQKRLERLAALNVPEIHYVGQIVSGRRISSDPSEGIICRWKVSKGKCWEHLGGDMSGQTHVGYCQVRELEEIAFNHPLDLHFAEAGVAGWGCPWMALQCFKLDWNGRKILAGYGFCYLPSNPGYHKIEVPIWRPSGSVEEEMHSYFLGRTPSLVSHEPIFESAWQSRCRLVTVGAGTVKLEVFALSRNTKPHNFDAVLPKA